LNIPALGWSITELTIRDKLVRAFDSTITETLPINLAIVLPKEIEFRAFNATVTIPGNPIPINNPSSSSTITLTVFNLQDYLLNTWNLLYTPLNGLVGLISGIIGLALGRLSKK
jgi:hypothetical protein